MNKFIKKIISFSLKNRLFIFLTTTILVIWGAIAFKSIPIEAGIVSFGTVQPEW